MLCLVEVVGVAVGELADHGDDEEDDEGGDDDADADQQVRPAHIRQDSLETSQALLIVVRRVA